MNKTHLSEPYRPVGLIRWTQSIKPGLWAQRRWFNESSMDHDSTPTLGSLESQTELFDRFDEAFNCDPSAGVFRLDESKTLSADFGSDRFGVSFDQTAGRSNVSVKDQLAVKITFNGLA